MLLKFQQVNLQERDLQEGLDGDWGGGNIRTNLKEIYINTENWVDSAQERDYWRALVNEALNPRVR